MTIIDLFTREPVSVPDEPTATTLCDGATEWLDGHGNIVTAPEVADRKAVLAAIDEHLTTRDGAIAAIRKALRERTGRAWSVTGGRGTAWGWITVTAPPARRGGKWGPLTADDKATLAEALNLEPHLANQGVSIPAGADYRAEYVARARGEQPTIIGRPYWD